MISHGPPGGPALRQNAGMAKSRSDEEQKAIEGVLRGLAFTLTRLRDEYVLKERRGEEPEGVSRGLGVALREVNDQLPRRKRVKE